MHVGPYSEEAPTIAAMHTFAESAGYKLVGKHHEIYLSDPRRTAPDSAGEAQNGLAPTRCLALLSSVLPTAGRRDPCCRNDVRASVAELVALGGLCTGPNDPTGAATSKTCGLTVRRRGGDRESLGTSEWYARRDSNP